MIDSAGSTKPLMNVLVSLIQCHGIALRLHFTTQECSRSAKVVRTRHQDGSAYYCLHLAAMFGILSSMCTLSIIQNEFTWQSTELLQPCMHRSQQVWKWLCMQLCAIYYSLIVSVTTCMSGYISLIMSNLLILVEGMIQFSTKNNIVRIYGYI